MGKKIFIDCGFYCGGALWAFQKTPEYSEGFEYYAFDPAMNLEASKVKFPHVNLYKKAVWISDGEIEFYTSGRMGGRANGLYHNKRASRENVLKIASIDFSSWIKNNFSPDDYIIVKMDIEGAEFEVIPKMISDGTINYVDIIYLELHGKRVQDTDGSKTTGLAASVAAVDGLTVRKSIERYLRSIKRSK